MKSTLCRIMIVALALIVSGVADANTSLVDYNRSEVTLRVSQYNVKKKEMVKLAIQEALQRVMFRGVADTPFSRALCGTNEAEMMKKHKDYFNKLLNSRYDTFVTAATPVTVNVKDATGKKAFVTDVTVNVVALRQDLEQQKIIRKFGL